MPSSEIGEVAEDILGWGTPKERLKHTQWGAAKAHSHENYVPLNVPVYSIAIRGGAAVYPVSDYAQTLLAIREGLNALESKISELVKTLQVMERLQDQVTTKTMAIHGLGSKKYGLRKPLFTTLENYADEVVARLPEFDLYASGENEAEALALLQQEIVDLYEDLRESKTELGGLPVSWLQDLGDYIEERMLENG